MDFELWMQECRKIAKERGMSLPDFDEEEMFSWKNQWENQVEPGEAVYYYQQTLGEG